MAGIADDFAFFSHQGVAALRAGVEKLLGLIGVALALNLLTNIKKRRKGFNYGLGFFIAHGFTLTRCFSPIQAV